MGTEVHHSVWGRSIQSHNVRLLCFDSRNMPHIASISTSFGESAGAISVSLHMLAFGGKTDGLFRAALMMSGAPIPVGDLKNGQKYYDALVKDTGCSRAKDTLACLRTVPYDRLKAAINKSPSIFSYQVNGNSMLQSSLTHSVIASR